MLQGLALPGGGIAPVLSIHLEAVDVGQLEVCDQDDRQCRCELHHEASSIEAGMSNGDEY